MVHNTVASFDRKKWKLYILLFFILFFLSFFFVGRRRRELKDIDTVDIVPEERKNKRNITC